jgi:hypothetical protein
MPLRTTTALSLALTCFASAASAQTAGFDPSHPQLLHTPSQHQKLTPQEERAVKPLQKDEKRAPIVMMDDRYVTQVRQLPPDLREAEFDYITKNPDYRQAHQKSPNTRVTRLKPVTPTTENEPQRTLERTPTEERWERADDRLRRNAERQRMRAFDALPESRPATANNGVRERISPFDNAVMPDDQAVAERERSRSVRQGAFDRPESEGTTDAFSRGRNWQNPAPNNIARRMHDAPAFERDDDRINAFSREREYQDGQPSYVDPQPVTVRPFDNSLEKGR